MIHSNPPLSSFKKLIMSAPRLLPCLHTMSLAKADPDGLMDRECERIALYKCPLVPYVPEKDTIQETVSALNNGRSLKTTIGEGADLRFSIWHTGIRKALLMHVGSTLDVIKKQGHFMAYIEAHELYVEQHEMAKQAKAALAEPDRATSKGAETSKKSSKKAKEAMAMADATEPELQANFLLDLKKAKEAAENTKGKMDSAAKDMFQFYANLLSVEAKYAWSKIVIEKTASNHPYTNIQGASQKGPRGPLRKSFDDCVMVHLLIVFPSNLAEQERYYITNMLKKPQCISMHQFVHRVEQLNSYIAYLPCFHYNQVSIP
jgi:hypothetical protein